MVGWDADGQIQKAVLFKGKRKVSKTTWHNNGRLKLQTNYESSRRALHELPETDWDSWPYNTIDMDIDFGTGKPKKINPYGVLMISRKSWYKNGNVKNEWALYVYHYVDIGWYESGQLKYNHGDNDILPSGSMYWWHENGQKEREGSYKNGKFDGKWTVWYESGQKESEVNYKNGKLDGKLIEWFQFNGEIKREENYKNGKICINEC